MNAKSRAECEVNLYRRIKLHTLIVQLSQAIISHLTKRPVDRSMNPVWYQSNSCLKYITRPTHNSDCKWVQNVFYHFICWEWNPTLAQF